MQAGELQPSEVTALVLQSTLPSAACVGKLQQNSCGPLKNLKREAGSWDRVGLSLHFAHG